MMRQRGFVLPALLGPVVPYALIAVGVAMLGLAVTAKVQTVRLHHTQTALGVKTAEFDLFKRETVQLGKQAIADRDAKIAEGKLKKEQADVEHAKTVTALNDTIAKLRHDRDSARGSIVPAAPTGSKRPDLACFDRPALESAHRELFAAIRGGADEGTAATVDLDTAKRWAQP